MTIQIQSPHLKANEALNERIIAKLKKAFERYPYVTSCRVFLKVEQQANEDPCELEVYLHAAQKELFANAKGDNFIELIPPVVDKLKRQLEKYKQKKYANP